MDTIYNKRVYRTRNVNSSETYEKLLQSNLHFSPQIWNYPNSFLSLHPCPHAQNVSVSDWLCLLKTSRILPSSHHHQLLLRFFGFLTELSVSILILNTSLQGASKSPFLNGTLPWFPISRPKPKHLAPYNLSTLLSCHTAPTTPTLAILASLSSSSVAWRTSPKMAASILPLVVNFICQLSQAMVPRYLVKHQLDVAVNVFLDKSNIYIVDLK